MTTGSIQRMIYFPSWYDEKKEPRVLYVISRFEDEYKGSFIESEIADGRFSFYKASRCIEYSDEKMYSLNELVEKRKEIEIEIAAFLKPRKRVKAK